LKVTDYSKIAEKYDRNPIRIGIQKDPIIESLLKNNSDSIAILDLACGTGNYLNTQMTNFPDDRIKWYGLDFSDDMLSIAKKKTTGATLVKGDAHCLPFQSETFDFVKINFAFHHFLDKQKVVAEIYRVLKKNGILSIVNISPDYTKKSWVYHYFPGSVAIDQERFITTEEIFELLESHTFNPKITIDIDFRNFPYKDIIIETENRDMSQLHLISEDEYQKGLSMIKEDSMKNQYFKGDTALIHCMGVK
jgi:ubiquinone/menaquinone biosynthesis C-methylase UbiE